MKPCLYLRMATDLVNCPAYGGCCRVVTLVKRKFQQFFVLLGVKKRFYTFDRYLLFTRCMENIPILVVQSSSASSRRVYNSMCMILEALLSFIFVLLCIFVLNSFRFWPVSALLCIRIWDISCWACSQSIWILTCTYNEERKNFLSFPMLIPFIDCKMHNRCARVEIYRLCPGYTQCKPSEGFIMQISAENCKNLKPIFDKNA